MATGLGKTWLAAFDSSNPRFRRVLFIAHREEILNQALATFRRIRPESSIGLYSGAERTTDAEILFASIQTLSRREHLSRFARDAFDYVVVDEFHHASAATYRRLIEHFDPEFMLGLTATPERMDGGDLLALCGENLVYRCAVPRGIELGLLCPFEYFGVPDDVDYSNIPWRSSRFDEERLTEAVATQRRAQNVFEQWKARGGDRTVGFCVSQRHADFMRDWFSERGVPCASVHSGPTSDPRALSLEGLASGELNVLFAVDMFNEGVDVPAIDTVMMLRPTESPIVWLQQFGRGLRKHENKRLRVVDYIGNHRSFLLKVRTLFEVQGGGDRELRAALERAAAGEHELPPGCGVTYDLQALDILRALLRTNGGDALREYYEDFRARHGQRPNASEAFHDGYVPRSARSGYGSWFGLVAAMGDFDAAQAQAIGAAGEFLAGLEVTRMVRSFKMLLLQAMLNLDAFPGDGVPIDELTKEFARLAARSDRLRSDVGPVLSDSRALREMLLTNPIAAWTGVGAMQDQVWFEYRESVFRFIRTVPEESRAAFQTLVRELVDWRLAEYLSRTTDGANHQIDAEVGFPMRVSHNAGRPVMSLPDRDRAVPMPEGWQNVMIDGRPYEANFVKDGINLVRPQNGEENALPAILRGWFGPDAGLPGTDHQVVCQRVDGNWLLRPKGRRPDDTPELFRRYAREQIPRLFGEEFNPAIWNAGFVTVPSRQPKHVILLVTLDKGGMAREFQYGDHFLSPDEFQWQSQNRTRQDSAHGRLIRDHAALGARVHLFVRREKKRGATSAPFVYCGQVRFFDWEGDAPITVRWRLENELPERIAEELLRRPTGE
jgi:superfamily II DNA or RNA helicase